MDIFSRNRLTGWLIGILVVLNLLTLGTLWYRETMHPPFPGHSREAYLRQKQEERFKKEVGLDQEQIDQFNEKQEAFFALIHPEKQRIHQLNTDIMNESFAMNPDLVKIQSDADQIGAIEAKLPLLLFGHIQDLKQIAHPDQQEKLHLFFNDLFRHANPPRPPGPPGKDHPGKPAP